MKFIKNLQLTHSLTNWRSCFQSHRQWNLNSPWPFIELNYQCTCNHSESTQYKKSQIHSISNSRTRTKTTKVQNLPSELQSMEKKYLIGGRIIEKYESRILFGCIEKNRKIDSQDLWKACSWEREQDKEQYLCKFRVFIFDIFQPVDKKYLISFFQHLSHCWYKLSLFNLFLPLISEFHTTYFNSYANCWNKYVNFSTVEHKGRN